MPFYFTLDYLSGNYALVFLKAATTASIAPPTGPMYGILLAVPVNYS